MPTWKEKFNKKHKQPLDTTNSVAKIARLSGITVNQANQIVKKGMGAFKTNPGSVRPQVKSAKQWGIARLYSAVGGGKAAKVDAKELGKAKDKGKKKKKA